MEWLITWGVTEAAGALIYSIMKDLAQESGKDYVKQFFKNSLTNVLRLPEKDAQKKAYGKAIKVFLELFTEELARAGLTDEEINLYEQPLKTFIADEDVSIILGNAFVTNNPMLDSSTLTQIWKGLNLGDLPSQFNWEIVGKFYLKKVKEIIFTSEKLKEIFIVERIDTISEDIREISGIRTDFDLEKYAEGLKKQYGNLKLECLDTNAYEKIKLWQIFVPQKIKECFYPPQLYELPKERLQELAERGEISDEELELSEAEREKRLRDYVDQPLYPVLEIIESVSVDHKKIVVLGDPGAGKSSLLQYLALKWAEKNLSDRVIFPLPLLVELRIYARDKEEKKCNNFLEFFHQGNLFCHLNQHPLDHKLNNGEAIALFDGLDEIFDSGIRNEIVTDLKRFSIEYPKVKIIITSRHLGYKPEELTNSGFKHFMLQELDGDQIQDFVRRWHDLAFGDREEKTPKQERLQRAIAEYKAIRELAGNPLLLTMMAVLNRTQELPRDRPKLYERASDVLLHEWDVEKGGLLYPELKKYLSNIGLRDKQEILRSVANAMQARENGLKANLIYREELENILTKYLESTGIPQREAIDLTKLIIKQLRERNFILCPLGGDSFRFVHRTFLEYFCASEFYERFKKRGYPGGITFEGLKIEVFGTHWADSSWKEVLLLLTGMLSTNFKEITDDLINYLLDQNGETEEYSNIFLAADCFSELRNRAVHGEVSERLLESLKSLTGSDRVEARWDLYFLGKVVSKIATIWPDDPNGWEILKLIARKGNYWQGGKQAVAQLSNIAQKNSQVLPILQEIAGQGESDAIRALAQYWPNEPKTLPIIREQANQGEWGAIDALAQYWSDDPQTLLIIQKLAYKGEWKAIEVLAQYWPNEPKTLSIIQQHANQGYSSAIDALAQYWRNEPKTLPIIQEMANQGNSSAIKALATHWRNEPKTLPIIQQQANQGEEIAIEALVKHWRYDPKTLLIIQQQANQGNSSAIYALAQYWQDDTGTLSIIQKLAKEGEVSAIYLLIKHWRNDPKTPDIMRELANKDKETILVLAEYCQNDLETLPIIQQYLKLFRINIRDFPYH